VPDVRRRLRIALLAGGVLAVHLWLLAGAPRVTMPSVPSAQPAKFVARTVAPEMPVPVAIAAAQTQERPPAAAAPATQALPAPLPRPRATKVAMNEEAAPSSDGDVVAAVQPPAVASPVARAEVPATQVSGAAPAVRFAVPPSARFHYDVVAHTKGITLNGNARLDWRNDGREYEAQLTLSAPFLRARTQRSTGLVTPQGLAPVRFSDKYRSEEATHFDRENGKVVFSSNKPDAVLEAGVQDRLSIVLQLAAMMAGQPSRYPAGSSITVQTASTKEAEPWTFNVTAAETLDLPGGRVQALRLTRLPRKEYDVKLELWLAPGAAYAPVRLRLTQPNGDWVDQLWSSTDRG
jgi:hypothetical protein